MRVEQEQKVTEDARIFAEQDAAAQKYAAQVLQVRFLCFLHLCHDFFVRDTMVSNFTSRLHFHALISL